MNLVNIALSGLNANRVALDVTAQNVANINTPGYSLWFFRAWFGSF